MAITLPADLEINAFVGEGEEGCFHIELCCLLPAQESVSMSHHMYYLIQKVFALVIVTLTVFMTPFDPLSHLIRKQHARYPSCWNAAHSELIGNNVLRCTIRNVKVSSYSFNSYSSIFKNKLLNFSNFLLSCYSHRSASMFIIFHWFSTVFKAPHPLWNSTIR